MIIRILVTAAAFGLFVYSIYLLVKELKGGKNNV